MNTRNAIRAAILITALVLPTAAAHAEPAPIADDITCFPHALAPSKTDHNSIAPINFGFQVHCTGEPTLRNVTTKLWRYDTGTGKYYVHAERNDTSTNPDVETLYSASCSTAGVLYQFHTEVIANAFHGNWDRGSDNSGTIAAIC